MQQLKTLIFLPGVNGSVVYAAVAAERDREGGARVTV